MLLEIAAQEHLDYQSLGTTALGESHEGAVEVPGSSSGGLGILVGNSVSCTAVLPRHVV